MANQLSAFKELEGCEGVHIADRNNLRCTAIRLKDGRLCLFSPVAGLGKKALESLAELGEVAFLLAPNHYHNKGLAEYARTFPAAEACASEKAAPRLKKVTGVKVNGLTALEALLPSGAVRLEPEGLKTGEVWLSLKSGGQRCWLVVDAFCGPQKQAKQEESDEPEILKPFPTYGIGDKAAYRSWVLSQIRSDKPKMLVPCHGAVLRAPDLPERLEALVGKAFGN